jgi:15-cis-phytoene synthase
MHGLSPSVCDDSLAAQGDGAYDALMSERGPSSAVAAKSAPVAGALTADRAAAVLQSYRECARVVRDRARNFYLGLRLTPEPKRSALFAVYAWMRAADDIADAPIAPSLSRQRLAEFRETTRVVLSGEIRRGAGASDQVWLAFIDTVQRFNLRHEEFLHTLDALELDIHADEEIDPAEPASISPRFKTIEGLQDYCYGVASTVGIICTRIWGIRDHAVWDEARPMAIDRGYAFQFTNILRDIRADYETGRVYIPESVLEAHGLSPLELAAWSRPDRCAACVRDLAQQAVGHYDRSARLDEIIHPDGARPLWAMTRTYRTLLERIIETPSCVTRVDGVSLPTRAKFSILAGAMLRRRAEAGE